MITFFVYIPQLIHINFLENRLDTLCKAVLLLFCCRSESALSIYLFDSRLTYAVKCRECTLLLHSLQTNLQNINNKVFDHNNQTTMKKKFLLLIGIFSFGLIHSQIAINTDAPAIGTLLNVDPLGNNSSSNILKYQDDISVDYNGNMGIGTTTPQARLHIVSNSSPAFRLVDGNQGNKKLLICKDATGIGQWGEAVFSNFGTIPFDHITLSGSDIIAQGAAFYTGLSYTFSKVGVYSISITTKCSINNQTNTFVRWAQLLPTSSNIGTAWGASSPRFDGGYEIYISSNKYIYTSTPSGTVTSAYFTFNQTIEITETHKTIYLCMTGGLPSPTDLITFSWGVSATNPAPNGDSSNETSGSFIKIN